MKTNPCINCIVLPMCRSKASEYTKTNPNYYVMESMGILEFIKTCPLLYDYTHIPIHTDTYITNHHNVLKVFEYLFHNDKGIEYEVIRRM